MKVEGNAVCLGEDIDTDLIIAGRYLRTKDHSVWVSHIFEDLDPELKKRLDGSIIIAGKNFGCGSSREQAAVALKGAGVRAVIAPDFARIFFRNGINIGLPLVECSCLCREGAHVVCYPENGTLDVDGEPYEFQPLSERLLAILKSGGLLEYIKANQ